MYNILRYIHIFIIFIYITQLFQFIRCEFEETNDNSSTSPSIEIKLSPPENPLPEISDQIHDAEVTRQEIEDGLITKFKDTFNEKIVESRDKIKDCVEKNFNSILKYHNFTLDIDDLHHKIEHKHEKPSFLQLANNSQKSDIVPSSVRVMMDDVEELDPVVNQKIKQIEELRNDYEIQLFDRAEHEFDELLEITLIELEKNIKIQMDVFFNNLTHNGNHKKIHNDINHVNPKEKVANVLNQTKNIRNKSKSLLNNVMNEGNKLVKSFIPSFLQIFTSDVQQKLLNVKIGQPDKPYPTADDLVMNMEKRRDAAEKKIRNKILNIEMKFIMAHHEMVKDALHTVTTKLLSQVGKIHNRYI